MHWDMLELRYYLDMLSRVNRDQSATADCPSLRRKQNVPELRKDEQRLDKRMPRYLLPTKLYVLPPVQMQCSIAMTTQPGCGKARSPVRSIGAPSVLRTRTLGHSAIRPTLLGAYTLQNLRINPTLPLGSFLVRRDTDIDMKSAANAVKWQFSIEKGMPQDSEGTPFYMVSGPSVYVCHVSYALMVQL